MVKTVAIENFIVQSWFAKF